jgi:hypothetical protein
MADIDALRARWPASLNDLPEAALAVFAAWSRATEETIRKALEDEVGRGFSQPKGTYTKDHKCRDLTILRSPLPRTLRGAGARSALSARQLADIGTVSPARATPAASETPPTAVFTTPGTSTEERVDLLQTMLNQCLETMKVQQDQIGQHKATIDQLFQAQLADPEDVQTSAYVVGESVLRKLGPGTDGSYSWARVKPMPRHERNFILRTHAGTFAGFPPDLDLVTATKALKEVQAAKISLSTFATQEVAKYMMRNSHTVKMTGTVYSRIIEMREELEARRAEDDSFKEDLLVPMEDILEFLSTLEEAASGAMDIAIDNQTLMRTAVSKRLEEAIGVAHLRPETGKKAREDFLSAETLSLIEAAATRSEDLSWAAEGQKRLKNQRSSHGYRSQKSPGGGKDTWGAGIAPRGKGKGEKGKTTDKGKRGTTVEPPTRSGEDPS